MINVVEKAASDLGNLNQRVELYNVTTISIIEQAMSSQMKHEWVNNSQVKFKSLLQFLGEWKYMLEYSDASIIGTESYKEGGIFHAARQGGVVNGPMEGKGENTRDGKYPPKIIKRRINAGRATLMEKLVLMECRYAPPF